MNMFSMWTPITPPRRASARARSSVRLRGCAQSARALECEAMIGIADVSMTSRVPSSLMCETSITMPRRLSSATAALPNVVSPPPAPTETPSPRRLRPFQVSPIDRMPSRWNIRRMPRSSSTGMAPSKPNTKAAAWGRRARSSSAADNARMDRLVASEPSVGGRVPPGEPVNERLEDPVREVAEGAEGNDAHEHHVGLEPQPRVDDQIAEPGVGGDHLGRDHRRERQSHADAHAREDAVQTRGQHDEPEQLPARGAEALRGPDLVPRHAEDRGQRAEQHDERRGVGDEEELRALADAEPDERRRQERDRGDEAPELDEGVEAAPGQPDGSHQQSEAGADRAAEHEPREDPSQADHTVLQEAARDDLADQGLADHDRRGEQHGREERRAD